MSPTGHLAIGFAAKKITPKTHVLVLLIAAYLIDILYFGFLTINLETPENVPWSHSLLMAVAWSVMTILLTFLVTKKSRISLILGIVVFSHWFLDFIAWDSLPVAFDTTKTIGLGIYNLIGLDMTNIEFNSGMIIATVFELILLAFGLVIYFRVRKNHRNIKVK